VGCGGCDPAQGAFAPFPDCLCSGCVAFSQDPRRFITRLNSRRYLSCGCRLAITSNKRWCLPSEYAPSADLARKSAARRGPMWSSGMEQSSLQCCAKCALIDIVQHIYKYREEHTWPRTPDHCKHLKPSGFWWVFIDGYVSHFSGVSVVGVRRHP
jgi:hypothetical protein